MYDILWDPIFEQFYVNFKKEVPDITEACPLEEDDSFDRWLFGLAGIL